MCYVSVAAMHQHAVHKADKNDKAGQEKKPACLSQCCVLVRHRPQCRVTGGRGPSQLSGGSAVDAGAPAGACGLAGIIIVWRR